MSNNGASKNSDYEPGSASMVYVTIPDKEAAKCMARSIINANLAVSVNIVPHVTSVSRCEDLVQDGAESLMLITTLTSRVVELCAHVQDLHPFAIAEVFAMPISQGNPTYMQSMQIEMNQ